MADNIDDMLAWCNRARMILSATSSKKGAAGIKLDAQVDRVRVKLQHLIEMAGEATPVVKGFIESLDGIVLEASGLADVNDPRFKGKDGQKTLRGKAKAVTDKLKVLADQMDKSKPAKEILEARERFFNGTERARTRLKELSSQKMANTVEVEELLAFIENAEQSVRSEPAYQKPAECDKALQVISGWLGRLTRSMELSAQSDRQLDVAQSKAKPLVEERCSVAGRVLAEGKTSGRLTPEMEKKLEDGLKAIHLKCDQGLWTEALALCKSLPSASECSKAYLVTKGKVTADFGNELQLCDAALEQLRPLLDTAAMEQERSRYNRLISDGGSERLSSKQVTELRLKMKTLIEGWEASAETLAQQQTQLKQQIEDLQKRLGRRVDLVGLPQKAENARQLELVTGLRDQLLFASGLQAAATLSRLLDSQRPAMEDGRAWRKLADGVVQIVADLGTRAQAPDVGPQLIAEAQRLARALAPDTIARLTEVRDWKTLLLSHEQAASFLAALPKSIEKFSSFNGQRKSLDDGMAGEWQAVEQAIKEVEDAAGKAAVSPDPLLQPFRNELARLKLDWKDWLDNTTRESRSKIKATKAAAADLQRRIRALKDAEVLKGEAAKQADDNGSKLFETARLAFVDKQLRALLQVDALKGAEFRNRLKDLAGNEALDEPGKPWAKRIEALAELAGQATQAALDAKGRLERTNRTLTEAVAAQKLELGNLRKAMKTRNIDVGKFGPLFEALDTDLANLELLSTTGNMTAAQVNNRLLGELSARIRNLQLLVDHGSTFQDYTATLQRHAESIAQLKSDGLANVAAETAAALQEQLQTLNSELYGMEPKPAAAALRAMALAIDDARSELLAIRTQQDKVVLAAGDCLKRVASFAKGGYAETYRKSLESRVAAARKRSTVASELPAALRDLEAIQTELGEIEANPDAAFNRQKNVLAEQHATLKLKREWESRLAVINDGVLRRLDAALKSGGDKDQKDEVKRMVAMAEKAVKDNKDYERGLRLLAQVEGRVAQIERNPEGTALGDRKALPKHVESYAANVVKLRQSLENFVIQSLAQVKDPARQTQLRDALRKQVDPLSLQLNPGAFSVPLKSLLDKALPDSKRREAREQALARLRETLGFITGHPTMVKLAANPIVPLQADLRALDASLTRLEAHLRASVR